MHDTGVSKRIFPPLFSQTNTGKLLEISAVDFKINFKITTVKNTADMRFCVLLELRKVDVR